jgi:cobalt-zinc-cadmium efflux system membrane fusion protein
MTMPTPAPFLQQRLAHAGLLCLAALALLQLGGCKDAPPPPVAEAPAPILQDKQLRFADGHPQAAQLEVVAATPASSVTLELPARLVWNEERTQRIYPAFAGRVTAIQADMGATVQAGSTLATLASPDYGAAQADAAKARADLDFARKTLARQKDLLELGVAPRKDLEQAEADTARAQAELQRAQSRVGLYGGAAGVDQKLALRATLGGVVVERNLNPGQEVRPDQSGPGVPPLFVVSDPSTLWVQIDAREADAGTMRRGAAFELEVPALPGQRFEGRVTAVSDAIDASTRTIKVRGYVPNASRTLRAEMLATARFERSVGSGVMVPAQAVRLAGSAHSVFVRTAPGAFEPREVKIAWQGPKQVLVSRGLEVGEQVVSGNMLLLARMYRLAQEEGSAGGAAGGASNASGSPGATSAGAKVGNAGAGAAK